MISRTGWISVGAVCDCFFPVGRKRLFFLLRENRICNDDAWLGSGIHGEKSLVALPFCDGAMLKSCEHWER
jgi:hypothetical protein